MKDKDKNPNLYNLTAMANTRLKTVKNATDGALFFATQVGGTFTSPMVRKPLVECQVIPCQIGPEFPGVPCQVNPAFQDDPSYVCIYFHVVLVTWPPQQFAILLGISLRWLGKKIHSTPS